MPRVFDVFPFFEEVHIAYLRMKELASVVDKFVIQECAFTYGGQPRELVFSKNLKRFEEFKDQIVYYCHETDTGPVCFDRASFRIREAHQRNLMVNALALLQPKEEDIIVFSDCDEIPSAKAVQFYRDDVGMRRSGIHRLKQYSYYYNVNCLVDYGHDFASRARIGTWKNLGEVGSLYAFRMYGKGPSLYPSFAPTIERSGWHFSYFGGMEQIRRKVAAMSSGLQEYKLFGDGQLLADILSRKDLHHRNSEMPETFARCASDDPSLPQYLLDHPDEFPTFFESHFKNMQVHP